MRQALFLAAAVSVFAASNDPVKLDSGQVSGIAGATPEMRIYKGVPFAAPPVGPSGVVEDLVAFLRSTFGQQRLLWGSDWPVAEREGGYHKVLTRLRALFPEAERNAVFGDNAARIYGLPRDTTSPTT